MRYKATENVLMHFGIMRVIKLQNISAHHFYWFICFGQLREVAVLLSNDEDGNYNNDDSRNDLR